MDAPRNDLIRADMRTQPATREEGDGRTLFGHFSAFNRWYEIDSWEGHFLERVAPGAFAKTIAEGRDKMRVLYDHGNDPQLGNKPLGPIRELREDDVGAYYEVPLIDTSYNRDFVIPALDAGLLGASFRFRTIRDDWDDHPQRSSHNPHGIPERTLTEVAVPEFGPVTFGASQAATAGVRSKADFDLWQNLDDEGRAEFQALRARAFNPATSASDAALAGTSDVDAGQHDQTEPHGAALGLTPGNRAALLRSLNL